MGIAYALFLCILMGLPIHIDTICLGLPIVYFKRSQIEFYNHNAFLSLDVVLISANSEDPDEMQHYAFHLSLYCFVKIPN